jgi:hypothetical protein
VRTQVSYIRRPDTVRPLPAPPIMVNSAESAELGGVLEADIRVTWPTGENAPEHIVHELEVSARKRSFIHFVPLRPDPTGPDLSTRHGKYSG